MSSRWDRLVYECRYAYWKIRHRATGDALAPLPTPPDLRETMERTRRDGIKQLPSPTIPRQRSADTIPMIFLPPETISPELRRRLDAPGRRPIDLGNDWLPFEG